MSLMSSLYTGVSGLTNNQRGLTVSGHNLANVETNGFVRQQIEYTDSFYTKIGRNHTEYMEVGHGSDVSTVKQVRDVFLDKTYREERGREFFYTSQYEATNEVEDILGELQGVAFQQSLKDTWVALQELCKEPESIVKRSGLIETAVSFIDRAEEVYKQIKEYQTNLNTQIREYVNEINDKAKQIYELNHKIQKIEASGFENANDLRDQRNLLLDDLASIIKISYKEDATGIVTVYAEDYALVTEDLIYKIDTKDISEDSNCIKPYWPDYDGVDVFNMSIVPNSEQDSDVGALKGLLLARGGKVGKYTDIPVEPDIKDYTDELNGWVDQQEYNAALIEYNKQVEKYQIEVEASVLVSVQAQFDNLVHGICTMINDTLCPNKQVMLDTGEKIWILDEEKAPVGMEPGETMGEALFNRKSVPRYEEKAISIVNEDGTTSTIVARVYTPEDPSNNYSLFTIGEIEVNRNIMADPSLIPLSDNSGSGDYSIKICQELLEKWQEPFDTVTPTDFRKQNFNSYYTDMIGLLGTNGERFKNISQSQESLVNSVDNQRQAVHAVSSDEELTNIIRYQQGYNANSRFISTVSQMLEHLLNALGS